MCEILIWKSLYKAKTGELASGEGAVSRAWKLTDTFGE